MSDMLASIDNALRLVDELIVDDNTPVVRASRKRTPGEAEDTSAPSAMSCRRCKTLKVKCGGDASLGLPCSRCVAAGELECEYAPPGKPGRKKQVTKRSLQLQELRHELQTMRTAVLAGAARRPTSKPSPMASTPRDASSPLTTDAVPSSELYELENPLAILANLSLGHEFDDGLGGEGSASEVSQEQTDWVAQSQRFYGAGLYETRPDVNPAMCPVRLGILTLEDVQRLLDIYFSTMWHYLWLLSPEIHTPQYLVDTSPFLLAAVASAASFYDPLSASYSHKLHEHANMLGVHCFAQQYRSAEVVNAYAIMSHWTPPQKDWSLDRGWSWIGAGVRVASEIRLDQPLDRKEFSRYRKLTKLSEDQFDVMVADRARTCDLIFLLDLAMSVQTGRITSVTDFKFNGVIPPSGPIPPPTDPLYNHRGNYILNRVLVKALFLFSGLQAEVEGEDSDFRDAFNSSWKSDVEAWKEDWPHVTRFMKVHIEHVRLMLLSISLRFRGPAHDVLQECQESAFIILEHVRDWGDDPLEGASNIVVTNIAYGATLALKFLHLFNTTAEHREHVISLCELVVAALLRMATARMNASSMASIQAARLHSLIRKLAPTPTAPAPEQQSTLYDDTDLMNWMASDAMDFLQADDPSMSAAWATDNDGEGWWTKTTAAEGLWELGPVL